MAAGENEAPPPPAGDDGIALRTVGDVEREMAKVYRDMRKKRLAIADGNGLTQTLVHLAKVKRETVSDELLRRIEELEERQAKQAEQTAAH